MLYLGNLLYSKGFSITIIHTHYNAPHPDPAKFPNFTFCYFEVPQSKSKASGPLSSLVFLNQNCLDPFRDCLARVLKDDKEPIACLILDPLWYFAAQVADGFNLPRIALRTGGALALVLYATLPLLQQKGYFPVQEARKEDVVVECPPHKIKDLPPKNHYEGLVAMARVIKDCPHGLICNTFKELEGCVLDTIGQKFPSIPLFPLGPLHKYSSKYVSDDEVIQHQSYITWLDSQTLKSVLYVSFGTLADISYEEFLEVSWGLAKSMQPFLWVVRPELVNGSDKNYPFPDDFLEVIRGRGLIVPWVAQRRVLGHPGVGGFWSHCGWNSTLESISEGVPMICFPFFGDQMSNARQVSDVLKIGLMLENGLERKEIEGTIRRVMVGKEGDEMRERVTTLKNKAEECIGEGGSSCESLDQLTSHILSLVKLRE